MTDQNKSVETLQMDVDQVTADLTEAKKLTDEALKKAKAEEATVKAETTENPYPKGTTFAPYPPLGSTR